MMTREAAADLPIASFPTALALATGLLALGPTVVAAQTCAEEVDRLAEEFGVSTTLPQAEMDGPGQPDPALEPETGETMSEQLAESGGVIAPPPDAGEMTVIEPPAEGATDMPTAPEVAPAPPGQESDPDAAVAAERLQIQALLTAAHQAAEAGNMQQCAERLEEAKRLAANGGP